MPIKKVKLAVCICAKCGYRWIPKLADIKSDRQILPHTCGNPRCNSPNWDKPNKIRHVKPTITV